MMQQILNLLLVVGLDLKFHHNLSSCLQIVLNIGKRRNHITLSNIFISLAGRQILS